MAQTKEERQAYCRAYARAHSEELKQYRKVWYQVNLEEIKRKSHIYYQTHKKQHAVTNQENRDRTKFEVYSHYSGGTPLCAHCSITDIDILSIDHINNDGAKHRKLIGQVRTAGASIYYWLKRNGYPKGFQVLCYNCNMKKEIQRRKVERLR